MTKLAWAGLCMRTLRGCITSKQAPVLPPNKHQPCSREAFWQKQTYRFLIWLASLCFTKYMKNSWVKDNTFPSCQASKQDPMFGKERLLDSLKDHNQNVSPTHRLALMQRSLQTDTSIKSHKKYLPSYKQNMRACLTHTRNIWSSLPKQCLWAGMEENFLKWEH